MLDSIKKGEQVFREKQATALPGLVMTLLFIAIEVLSVWYFVDRVSGRDGWMAVAAAILFTIGLIWLFGLTPVSPNDARGLQRLGTYTGTRPGGGFWLGTPVA